MKETPPSGPAAQADEFDPSLYNPEDWPVWTIVMVLAWIATRDMDRVRWQMDEWRWAAGFPESTAALAALDAELDDDEPPMGFPAIPAIAELRRQCEAGAIVATALSSTSGDSGPIPADKWTYGAMSYDHDRREVWKAPKGSYSRITFRRKDVLELWPHKANREGSLQDLPAPHPKLSARAPSQQDLFISGYFQAHPEQLTAMRQARLSRANAVKAVVEAAKEKYGARSAEYLAIRGMTEKAMRGWEKRNTPK